MASMKRFAAWSALLSAIILMMVGPALAQAPKARQVLSGCSDPVTAKDYGGTIVWRSPTVCTKVQTLIACSTFNSGKWFQIVDGQGTASTNPITFSGSVSGPTLPVQISTDRNSYVLTCDGTSAQWLVTASAALSGSGGSGGGIALMVDSSNCLLVSPGICFLVQ
jgi:hypothetical protein